MGARPILPVLIMIYKPVALSQVKFILVRRADVFNLCFICQSILSNLRVRLGLGCSVHQCW